MSDSLLAIWPTQVWHQVGHVSMEIRVCLTPCWVASQRLTNNKPSIFGLAYQHVRGFLPRVWPTKLQTGKRCGLGGIDNNGRMDLGALGVGKGKLILLTISLGMLSLAGFTSIGHIINMVNAKLFFIFLLGLVTIVFMFLLALKEVGHQLRSACIKECSSEGV
ncbi:hypothetical protein K435DRAFT_810708 [Dendrothele bispora CBS 962.96]|uniref:Uncharacterized protein n=1 Tax=Dendrothele bispora (strain CBS 962.96) TaxID=1314807 RepID=A0A4S8KUJ9_DENBC|nr:hypothetical protein K435DRAFT_810708 [Dendrothele bispora CBS 962.96]